MYSKAVKVSSETRIHFRQTSISLTEAANKQITGGKSNRDSTGDLRCFICDGKITGTCFPLVVGVTPYSKTDIPTKIGQLMGEGFMVVVSEDDNLCKRCTSLLYQLDRLEVDLNLVKEALTNYLKLKYQLNEEDHEIATSRDDSSFLLYNEEENENDKASCKKLCGKEGEVAVDEEFKDGCENIPGILSSATKSPKNINAEIILDERLGKRRKKKRRTTDALGVLNGQSSSTNKEYKCSLCELKTPDISVYKAHSCNKYDGIKCENDFKSSQGTQKQIKNIHSAEWLCHICDMIFEEENMLASHIQTSSHNDMVHHKLQSGQPGNKKTSIFISGEYTCSICNFKTGSIVTYRDHQQFHFQNRSEYESSCKSFLKRAHGQKSNSYKTDDHFVGSTEKGSDQRVIQEELTCNLQNGITKDGFNILKAEDKVTVDTNYKMTENKKLATEDRIPNTEHYFCSSCSLVFPSDRLLQHHKNVHHTLPSLKKDTLLTTEITSHNFCDLKQKGCLDSNKSSNQYMNNENFMNLFKKVSTQFMQVPNRNNNNLNGTELAIENVSGRATSNSTTCTKNDCNSSQHADGEIDYTVSGKNEQQSATTQNSTFENSSESLVTTHRSHSSEATQVNNSIPRNFPINKFIENARTDSAVKQKGNSEKNVSSNSSHEYLLGAPYRDIQKSELVSKNGTESTKQKDCEMKAKVDNETSLSDSCGSISYPPQTMKEMRTPFLFHITKPGTAQCEICGKFFSSNSKMLYHRDICSKNLSCKLCNKHFLNMNDLHKHNSEKHQTHKMHHNCMHCSASFLTKEHCLTHEENCVFVPYCDECGEKFSEVDQLRSHKDTTHRDPHCRYCGKEILKLKTLRFHELRHMKDTTEKFECSECEKVFKTKTGLRNHFALHTGQYKFCCDYCGRGFMSRMMMEEHRSKHTKEERYICDVCGRKFCFQSTYWIHRKWHDNPFPYKCNFCGRKFRHSSLLAVHKRKHTGERPYKCPHCPLTFPVGGTLKRHIILHTRVYPYNCEICKRGFTTRHKCAIHLSKIHGDSKMLNEKSRPNEFKMVIRDNETVKKQDNVEPSAEWQNPDDSEQVDMNFRLGSSAGGVDNFDHLEGAMSCSLVPDELLVGNAFATRVVEIVRDDTSQAVAAVTVADPEANNLPDLWYQ
ncbi:zinc finger protein 91-like isoform X1 [Schistocerca serialis cubense]|uniref:zinc finger protein 91-like isoform X1 n=1 Tax=Schistocerca serialis cubense TaxID=2023355 RepID=UPI00214E835A|nr:zinc finger protein 91-like isoform X1 [Schistocerca serialis cubense]XP_049957217.1 zinc finger protein 91-like isoform X1 [Schistocerca serialis cubense]